MRISAFFIFPYCLLFNLDGEYLNQFEPESGSSQGHYSSFQDFFRRKYRNAPPNRSETVWPCEGYVCDWGHFSEKNHSLVKGQKINLNSIFASPEAQTKEHFFVNIFLHNHNYHRVHAPVDGVIKDIKRIPGGLVFLRPWFYKRSDVSYPAFRNERLVFQIEDQEKRSWWMAMVGGFGVGSIDIGQGIQVGKSVLLGQELGKFNLGSTVCLAIPEQVKVDKYLQVVGVGQALEKVGDNVRTGARTQAQ